MLTDFHNSFTDRFISKFAIESLLNTSPHLKGTGTLPRESYKFKNCHAQELSAASCGVGLSCTKNCRKILVSSIFTDNKSNIISTIT